MLIKMLPEQITSNWKWLGPAVIGALPPVAPYLGVDTSINILTALSTGKLQMWAVCREDAKSVNAVLTTQIVEDFATKSNFLLLYTLYGIEKMLMEDFTDGLQALKTFARTNKCTQIIAYTVNDKVIDLAKRLGGSVDWKIISFGVQHEDIP